MSTTNVLHEMRMSDDGHAIYRQLADMFGASIAKHDFVVGDKLPGQREIAQAFNVNVTTVTRAMQLLQQRGLIESRPGRGAVVIRESPLQPRLALQPFQSAPMLVPGLIDLTLNRPATPAYLRALEGLLASLPMDPRLHSVQDYHPPEGPAWARRAVSAWLESTIGPIDPKAVVLTNGAQHGLGCVLAAIAGPGDLILADALGYQGISALCHSRQVDIAGVMGDDEGMTPEDLDRLCKERLPKAVFLVPTFHNPTAATLSQSRRLALMEVLRRHDVLLIEDGVYDPLAETPLCTMASHDRERVFYIGGLSKFVAPGLRFGFVIAPQRFIADIVTALRIDCWSTSPLTALLGTRFIEDGTLIRMVATQKEELRHRQTIVANHLGTYGLRSAATCPHAWLPLPEPWRTSSFVATLREQGISVLGADSFAIGRGATPHAVRLNVAAAESRDALAQAVTVIAEVLSSGHGRLTGRI